MPTISIIVPVLNEAENIEPLVSQIVANRVPFTEILFVDGGSTDGTRNAIDALVTRHSIGLIEQDRKSPGLAAAIMAGARAAGGDILVVMDADLSHPPERINDLLAPLFSGAADMAIGSRYIPGGSTPGWPLWRRTMSRTASMFAQPLTGVRDSMCGFFAISRVAPIANRPADQRIQDRVRNHRPRRTQPAGARDSDRVPRPHPGQIEDVIWRGAKIFRALAYSHFAVPISPLSAEAPISKIQIPGKSQAPSPNAKL